MRAVLSSLRLSLGTLLLSTLIAWPVVYVCVVTWTLHYQSKPYSFADGFLSSIRFSNERIHSPPPTDVKSNSSSPPIHYYVRLRSDRSGAAIWDYLNAHAFCFRVGAVYGGACGRKPQSEPYLSRFLMQQQLIQDMGLSSILPIAVPCPSSGNSSHIVMKNSLYFERDGTRQSFEAFSPEWTRYMRSSMVSFLNRSVIEGKRPPNQRTIVVHIRRGDVEPCDNYTQKRYLTNQYYIDSIQDHVDDSLGNESTKVIVHSQNRSFEPWSDFESLQSSPNASVTLELKLDVPLIDVWYDMIVQADILVLSKSTFSTVPAVLSLASTVVCWPFPLCHSRWSSVGRKKQQLENARKVKLIQDNCTSLVDWRELRHTNRSQYFERMGEAVPINMS